MLINPAASLANGDVSAAMSALGILLPFIFAVLVALLAVQYFFSGYLWLCIGRKAGMKAAWMPFVPVAADIYRLRIVRAPRWQAIFFGFTGILCLAAAVALLGLLAFGSPALSVIFSLAWLVVRYIVTYRFYRSYYEIFGFNPMMALIVFIPASFVFSPVFDMLIAFKKDVLYTGPETDPKTDPAENGAPVPPIPPCGRGRLTAIAGMYRGAVFNLADQEEIVMGRDSSVCQIVFDQYSADVSPKHCTISFSTAAGNYTVTDHSALGTFTRDGRRLPPHTPVTLERGSILCIGSRKNVFRLD